MAETKGATLVAQALKQQGIKEVFGVVGYPVFEVAHRIQEAGINYYGTRHEQTAGFAAQAAGYLRRGVSAALTVSGPGMSNAITAMENANQNCWPLVVLSGSSDLPLAGRGAFQESPQVAWAQPFTKWAGQARTAEEIPRMIEQAVRHAWHGRPGATYVDLPADVLDQVLDDSLVQPAHVVPPPSAPKANSDQVERALKTLRKAKRPLVIVGKGAAWADASPELIRFLEKTGIPFLPTPMGKGTVPDDHPLAVSAARSKALGEADAIFLAGARLNWILHFGLNPRFAKDVKIVQADIAPEAMGMNIPTEVSLTGDLKTVMGQMLEGLESDPWHLEESSAWKKDLGEEVAKRKNGSAEALTSEEVPMGYYRPLQEIQNALPKDAIIISEGSNTMDISRTVLENYLPRHRLDAGTWGTMGVGCGFALAAAAVHPEKRVVAVMGDGAFGFSGMEVEVAIRYNLPITWIVINNNGIGIGTPEFPKDGPPPVQAYTPGIRYEKLMDAFGGLGFQAETPDELARALKQAEKENKPAIIHVPIHPHATRAAQSHSWLTR